MYVYFTFLRFYFSLVKVVLIIDSSNHFTLIPRRKLRGQHVCKTYAVDPGSDLRDSRLTNLPLLIRNILSYAYLVTTINAFLLLHLWIKQVRTYQIINDTTNYSVNGLQITWTSKLFPLPTSLKNSR